MAGVLFPTVAPPPSPPATGLPPAMSSAAVIHSWSRFNSYCFRPSHLPASSVAVGRPFLPYPASRHRPGVCFAASPEPGPPSEDRSLRLKDVGAYLSRLQSTVQIFFAILFWMSLFFWASAWDGRNRPDKGSRFRR